jgi:hypothetical protein
MLIPKGLFCPAILADDRGRAIMGAGLVERGYGEGEGDLPRMPIESSWYPRGGGWEYGAGEIER